VLTFKQFLLEMKPVRKFYHLGPVDLKRGEDLRSLHKQIGILAGDEFKKKWGKDFSPTKINSIAKDHTKKVWVGLDTSWDGDSKKYTHYEIWHGKKMNPVKKYSGDASSYTVDDEIPAKYIRRRMNPTTRKWENWN